MHCPLQVPASYEDAAIENEHARLEDAMANALDEGIGNVTRLIKSRGMWNDTILFFSADNGGPVHDPAGGCPGQSSSNNFPLRGRSTQYIVLPCPALARKFAGSGACVRGASDRLCMWCVPLLCAGGKVSDFEGGVRVVAFLSGGALPKGLAGGKREGMLHIADIHATLCFLGGVPIADTKALAGVPPVDGINMWPYLTGAVAETPRTELFLAWWSNETVFPAGNLNKPITYSEYTTDGAMIMWPYKWIRGFQLGMAFWTSENHPNNTDPWNTCKNPPAGGKQPAECPPPGYVDGWPFIACWPEPCLFNIEVRRSCSYQGTHSLEQPSRLCC